ncbi:MAG: hypothetical protein PUA81_07880 [Oscillospiraceae bacterium]|nr:hypothetical protein [Oscillospiraceae bacterium]
MKPDITIGERMLLSYIKSIPALHMGSKNLVYLEHYIHGYDNLVHKVLAGDWLVDATEESCEANKNTIMLIIAQSPLLVAVKNYDE